MKLLLFVSLLVVAYAHDDCGGDCLKACRSCTCDLANDGPPTEDGESPFHVGSRVPGDCKQLVCKDRNASLIVEGTKVNSLICFQGAWHFGYPEFLEEVSSAQCIGPTNTTCPEGAEVIYDQEYKCQCKANFDDVTEDFPDAPEDKKPLCTNCGNKHLNITFLIDNSGSMKDSLQAIKDFITPLVTFLKVSATGNNIAVMSSDYSYDLKINWGDDSHDQDKILGAVSQIEADGQSYLATGLEAVKAVLVQPTAETTQHKLVVFTDGSIKCSTEALKALTRAANNLEHLKVETFVVAVNTGDDGPRFKDRQFAIANGVEENVFPISADPDDVEENFDIVNKLQRRICA